ncbi:hypothetical protein [Weissella confusa]|uniref:hypothetical protein n=1 Tax=Weissella confusa TaxID=1583 RepID=UPI0018F1E7F2|nr:hypothetical protein [Weissella confusa]MBJ7625243.1 hypothetical protein [Weissella confusa]MBJ7650235.1 hypothetical protein [Weissella confusa]MBJ7662150.1 hypothetical protein [Weissella confusa]MBJ7676599.1 hypothetical protein [Weissella confusa]
MSKTYQEFVEARKRNERKMPFAPVVTGPLLFPFFKDVLEPVPEVMINDDGLPVVVTKDDLLYFLKHNISPFVTVGMANKTMWEAMNAIKAASHSDWAKSGPGLFTLPTRFIEKRIKQSVMLRFARDKEFVTQVGKLEKITAKFAEGDPDKQPELTTWYLG